MAGVGGVGPGGAARFEAGSDAAEATGGPAPEAPAPGSARTVRPPRPDPVRIFVEVEKFLARFPHDLEERIRGTAVKDHGRHVDAGLAKKRFPKDLLATFRRLAAGGDKVASDALRDAFVAEVAPKVREAARANKLLSIREARLLSDTVKWAFREHRADLRGSERYDRALHEPFPDGEVDQHLFFERHLPMERVYAGVELIERFGLVDRLPELVRALAAGPKELPDGTKVRVEERPRRGSAPLDRVEGRGPKVVVEAPDGAISVASGGGGGELAVTSFLPGETYPWGGPSTYRARSVYEELESMMARHGIGGAAAGAPKPDASPAEKVLARFENRHADVPGLARIARAVDHVLDGGRGAAEVEKIASAHRAKETELTGEYLRRLGAARKLLEVAAAVREKGAQSLGDDDLDISLADEYRRTRLDDEDREVVEATVRGEGPLLVLENNASGSAYAVRLDALARGEVDAFTFSDDGQGRVKVGPPGTRVDSVASHRTMYGFTFDLGWAHDELGPRRGRGGGR